MNFKGFLKSRYSYIFEEILNESPEEDAFKKAAYRRVFREIGPDPDVANDADKAWNAVLNKARYKLVQGSNDKTRRAVAAARGAKTQAKQRNINTELKDEDKENRNKKTNEKVLKHLEDWSDDDFQKIKEKVNGLSSFSTPGSLEDLKRVVEGLDQNYEVDPQQKQDVEDLFEIIKTQEDQEDDKSEKEWKEKTVDDLESLSEEDKNKIIEELKKTDPDVTPENLEEKINALDQDARDKLDNLLNAEATPAEPKQETKPETTNQEALARIQEQQRKEKLQKKLRDNNVPVKEDGSPDFDNPETLKKINDLMVNGDDELYNEFVKARGGEKSDLVREVQERAEQENEIIRKQLEDRQARRDAEVESQKRICNFALALDIICSALSGKATDVFSTLAEKRGKAKAYEKSLEEGMNQDIQKEIGELEKGHAAELDNIKTEKRQRLEQLEKDRSDPTQTLAYKRKATEIMNKYHAKREELKKRGQELQPKKDQNAETQKVLWALSTGKEPKDLDSETLKKIFPKTDPNEDDTVYEQRIEALKSKSPEELQNELEQVKEQTQTEIEQYENESQNLDKEENDELQALKEDPEVKNEIKDLEADYEFKKKNILDQTQSLINAENERHQKKIRARRQAIDNNKRFAKNISTMMAWASNPQDVLASEMLTHIKQQKMLFNSIGEQTNPEDFPEDLEGVKKMIKERMSKGGSLSSLGSQGSRRGDDDTGGFGGSRRPPRQPGHTGGEPKQITAQKPGTKAYEELKARFSSAPRLENRFKEFLKNSEEFKNLDPSAEDVDQDLLQEALEELKNQKFPDNLTGDELKKLGLTENDIPDGVDPKNLEEYAKFLKNDPDKLNELKKDLGFEEGTKSVNNEAINVKFDSNILSGVTIKDSNGNPVTLTDQTFGQYRNNPEVLKAFSKGKEDTNEFIDQGCSGDTKQDPTEDKDKKSLGNYSLKTLWKILQQNNISIRTLEGYRPNMTVDEKRKLIAKFLNTNKNELNFDNTELKGIEKNLITESKHRKTAFRRLNEVSQAQKRMSERRSLKKFSELLVHDVRTFGV